MKKDKIKALKGKKSKSYLAYANDFSFNRFSEWHSIFYQVHPIVMKDDIFSVLEFGGGGTLLRH
mgnify:CR=1 FL=1